MLARMNSTRFLRTAFLALATFVLTGSGLAAADAAAPRPTIRIKAAATAELKDETGVVWQADRGFDGGDTVERPDITIEGTKTPSLYRSERYSMGRFTQALPNGKYTVKLHFAETFEEINGKGQRVFSFNVQGKPFNDFDVFEKAGGASRACVVTVDVEVKDGVLTITFTPKVENPQINAIEIIPAA